MGDEVAVMMDGAVKECGNPRQIYERPCSAPVMSFLGDANLFSGTVTRIDGEVATVRLDGGEVVRGTASEALRVGSRVTAGIRPEHTRIGKLPDSAAAATSCVKCHVEEVMFHGSRDVVIGQLEAGRVKAFGEARGAPVEAGDVVSIDWSAEDCRLFAEA